MNGIVCWKKAFEIMRNCEKNGRDKRAIEVENNEEQTINTRRTRGTGHGHSSGASNDIFYLSCFFFLEYYFILYEVVLDS